MTSDGNQNPDPSISGLMPFTNWATTSRFALVQYILFNRKGLGHWVCHNALYNPLILTWSPDGLWVREGTAHRIALFLRLKVVIVAVTTAEDERALAELQAYFAQVKADLPKAIALKLWAIERGAK